MCPQADGCDILLTSVPDTIQSFPDTIRSLTAVAVVTLKHTQKHFYFLSVLVLIIRCEFSTVPSIGENAIQFSHFASNLNRI